MEYRNEKTFAILITDLGKVVQPYERIILTEEQLQLPTVKHYIAQNILVPFTKIGDVVLPLGVERTPSEFGTVLVDGFNSMPGTAQVKTLDEVIVEKSAELKEGMDQIGEDLKKK